MDIIRQKINMVAEEVIKKENNDMVLQLNCNSFIIVYNKYKQMYNLDDLLENELSEKLHGREKFELITLLGDEKPENIKCLMEKMTEDCIKKSEAGLQVFARASLELVIADNNCSIEFIDMIHSMACKVFKEEKGFKLECTDYLVLDLSGQEQMDEVSDDWLYKLEMYYKKHNFIPFICTEEPLVIREEKYKKTIKTISSLITINTINRQNINVQQEIRTTWKCAACIEDDKLRHYITGLFYKFMSNQNTYMMSERGYIKCIESFLQDNGITINTGEVAREMRRMPINLEDIIQDGIHPLSIIKKTKLIAAEEVITKIYGNNNPICKYADLNYLDIHISGCKEYLWEKFQTEVPGTRKDVETYLKNVIGAMIKGKEEEFRKWNEILDDNKNIKIKFNKYSGKNNKLFIEKLFNALERILRLMSELENINRELTVLKFLYNMVNRQEFRQKLEDIRNHQNKIINFLGNSEKDISAYYNEDYDGMFNELFKSAGYWKMETIEEDIRRKITQSISIHSQEIFKCQKRKSKENFCYFLENVWKRKNKINGYEAKDFWAVRNDRLRPPLKEHEYILINKDFFEENINEKELLNSNFSNAELVKTSHKNIFSIEYINIHDMDCLQLLITKKTHEDVNEYADNRPY